LPRPPAVECKAKPCTYPIHKNAFGLANGGN